MSLAVLLAGSALAQVNGPLTDQRIIELVKSGVRTDELSRLIATAPAVSFDLTPAATQQMMDAGVSEDIIKAMSAREQGAAGPSGNVAPSPEQNPTNSAPAKTRHESDEYIHRGSKEVGFSGSGFVDHADTSVAFGVGAARFGAYVSRSVEIGGDFTFAGSSDAQLFLPTGFVRYVIHTANPRVFPFVGAEAGELIAHDNYGTGHAFGAKGEVGIKYFVSHNVSVDTAYNLLYMYLQGGGFKDSTASMLSVGFSFTF